MSKNPYQPLYLFGWILSVFLGLPTAGYFIGGWIASRFDGSHLSGLLGAGIGFVGAVVLLVRESQRAQKNSDQ